MWDRKMVYPRQDILRMEEERFCAMDTWQSYAYPIPSDFMTIHSFPNSVAGTGKTVLSYAAPRLLFI